MPLSIHHLPLPISFALFEVGRAAASVLLLRRRPSCCCQVPAAQCLLPATCLLAPCLIVLPANCLPACLLPAAACLPVVQGGELLLVDPSLKEEAAADGKFIGESAPACPWLALRWRRRGWRAAHASGAYWVSL